MSQPEPVRVRKRLGGGFVVDFPLLGGTAYEAVCSDIERLSEWLQEHFEEPREVPYLSRWHKRDALRRAARHARVGAANSTRIGVDGVEVLIHMGRASWGCGMETIPNRAGVTAVTFEPPFFAMCSISGKPFWGTIKIEYRPGSRLLEFISVEAWISTLASQEVTIEEVARIAFDEVSQALGDIPLRVTVSARTTVHAPVSAEIRKGDWK